MRYYAPKIAALAYLLWGVIHVAGGAAMLYAALLGPEDYLRLLAGSPAAPLGAGVTLPNAPGIRATQSIFAFHGYNILWLGLLVGAVAVLMNWRNSVTGYWLNIAIAGMADLGLLVFMVAPGIIPLTDAWIGPALFVIGALFATVGRSRRRATSMLVDISGQPLAGA